MHLMTAASLYRAAEFLSRTAARLREMNMTLQAEQCPEVYLLRPRRALDTIRLSSVPMLGFAIS
jgi:hypothetical protein